VAAREIEQAPLLLFRGHPARGSTARCTTNKRVRARLQPLQSAAKSSAVNGGRRRAGAGTWRTVALAMKRARRGIGPRRA